jgi:hypothetical protein
LDTADTPGAREEGIEVVVSYSAASVYCDMVPDQRQVYYGLEAAAGFSFALDVLGQPKFWP